jgi:hypothetical protein
MCYLSWQWQRHVSIAPGLCHRSRPIFIIAAILTAMARPMSQLRISGQHCQRPVGQWRRNVPVSIEPDYGHQPFSIIAGDFNGDGMPILPLPISWTTTCPVYIGNGTGKFPVRSNYNVDIRPLDGTIGDFNGDGKTDLAVVNQLTDNVSILLETATGHSRRTVNYAVGTPSSLRGIGRL